MNNEALINENGLDKGLDSKADNEFEIRGLERLREDNARKQKCGLPFILASVVIWLLISLVSGLKLDVTTRNFLVFCCSCPLMPLAWIFGKAVKVDIFEKGNPLGKLGLVFTLNQLIYLLIVMWAFSTVPDKMVMIYAMVFGAHLFPYFWLYKTKTYLVSAILIPVLALAVGLHFPAWMLAIVLTVYEAGFSAVLCLRCKNRR